MKTKNKESSETEGQSSDISSWWCVPFFVGGILLGCMLATSSKPKPEPDPVATFHFEAKPEPNPTPEKVTHRVVSNGEKFAGQVLVTSGGCWDRWYQLQERDSWKEAQRDLQLGDCFDFAFKPVTEAEAEVIGFKNQIKQLESRVKALEPKPTNDWSFVGTVITNYIHRSDIVITNHSL